MYELTAQTRMGPVNLILSTGSASAEEKATKGSSNIKVMNFNVLAANTVHYCPWYHFKFLTRSVFLSL